MQKVFADIGNMIMEFFYFLLCLSPIWGKLVLFPKFLLYGQAPVPYITTWSCCLTAEGYLFLSQSKLIFEALWDYHCLWDVFWLSMYCLILISCFYYIPFCYIRQLLTAAALRQAPYIPITKARGFTAFSGKDIFFDTSLQSFLSEMKAKMLFCQKRLIS